VAALVGVDAELAADVGMKPPGQALGGLHAEAVDVELLGELVFALKAPDQLDLRLPTEHQLSFGRSR